MKPIIGLVVLSTLLFSTQMVVAAPAASIVPGRSGPHTSVEPTNLVVEASLNNVHDAAEQLERNIHALYREMTRHSEVDSWNGLFEPAPSYYGSYSPAYMMPVGPGLETDVSDGPLMEPRDEVVNKCGAAINQNNGKVCDVLQSTKLPAGAPSAVTARWEALQSTSASLKSDCQKLNAFLQDPDYDQTKVSKFLTLYRDDATGLKNQCKKIAQMLRHDR